MWMTCVSSSRSFEASGARARFAAVFTAMRLLWLMTSVVSGHPGLEGKSSLSLQFFLGRAFSPATPARMVGENSLFTRFSTCSARKGGSFRGAFKRVMPSERFRGGRAGLNTAGFQQSHYLLEKQALRQSAMATRSECEREAREAAANLVLSTVLPHSVRMGTRVLETLDDMWEILSYDSIGCKQALPIFEELVKAGQEPAGENYPATNLEHRLVEWLDRREAAREASVSAPAHLLELEEEGGRGERGEQGERGERAGEAGAGNFLAAKGRRAARGGFHEEQGRSRLPQQQPRSGSLQVPPHGPGCVRSRTAGVPLQGGGRQVPGQRLRLDGVWAKLSLLTSATTSCFDPKEGQTCGSSSTSPPSGVHPALQAWQGEASQCREADGQLLGAEGDHAGSPQF